jgi:hypothetical protein
MKQSTVIIAGLGSVMLMAAVAQADPTPRRVNFFACVAGSPIAKSVPADTPLFFTSGWGSGNLGLVQAAIPKIVNTFSVTYPDGSTVTFNPGFQPIRHNADDTWTAPFRVDFGSLHTGESLTIHWTGVFNGPVEDIVPPSDAWDPAANFQPPWDGIGLKYQNHIAAGPFDNGTCTVTAT